LSPSFSSHVNTDRHSCPVNRPISKQTAKPSSSTSIWSPRSYFRLACLNLPTMLQIGQQTALAQTLEALSIDICCLLETRLQDSSSVLILQSPSGDTSNSFSLRPSGNDAASSTGQAGVGIALSPRAGATLLDWIPLSSRLCAVRLAGSFKSSKARVTNRYLFVIATYAPTKSSDDSVQYDFYRQLNELFSHKSSHTVVQAGDLNAQFGKLSTDELHLGGQHGIGSRIDNGERLLRLCEDARLFFSLELIDARRHIPNGSEHNETRKELQAKLRGSLKGDRESLWFHREFDREMATALDNHRKLFRLVRETGSRRPGVSETIRDESGQPIHNLSKRLERWADHFERQFNRSELLDFSPSSDHPAPWDVPLDPLSLRSRT
ncbi:unnamed protein product, partial [Dicrocoelium dendriticum]